MAAKEYNFDKTTTYKVDEALKIVKDNSKTMVDC